MGGSDGNGNADNGGLGKKGVLLFICAGRQLEAENDNPLFSLFFSSPSWLSLLVVILWQSGHGMLVKAGMEFGRQGRQHLRNKRLDGSGQSWR